MQDLIIYPRKKSRPGRRYHVEFLHTKKSGAGQTWCQINNLF